MTREEIEEEAGRYSGTAWGFADNPYVMNNHRAFAAGANWRVNSVYHDMTEVPDDGEIILALTESGIPVICGLDNTDMLDTLKEIRAVRWAYIKDITPDMEERP